MPRGRAVTVRGRCVSLRADEHRELERITQRAAHSIALCSAWQPLPCPQRFFPLAHEPRRVRAAFPRPAPCPRPAPPPPAVGAPQRCLWLPRPALGGRCLAPPLGLLGRGAAPRPASVPALPPSRPRRPAPPSRLGAGGAAATPAPAAMTTEDEIIRIAKKMDKMVQKKNAVSRGGARRGPRPAPHCLLLAGPSRPTGAAAVREAVSGHAAFGGGPGSP